MKFSKALTAALLVGLVACGNAGGSDESATDLEGPETAEDVSDLTAAKVTLRVPLLDDEGKLLSRHNPKLKAGGLGAIPDTVEIEAGANGVPARNATKKWEEASALVDKAAEELNLDLTMRDYEEPYRFQTKDPATTICYRGNPLLVAKLVSNLSDSVMSDQLGIHGWRYRQTKQLAEPTEPEFEADFPSIWKNWRGRGAAVLILTASSDDGSEINVGLISKCQ